MHMGSNSHLGRVLCELGICGAGRGFGGSCGAAPGRAGGL